MLKTILIPKNSFNIKKLNYAFRDVLKNLTSLEQRKIIRAVTTGNILDGIETYSYAFLVPIFSKKIFHFDNDISNLSLSFLLFGIGFFGRMVGTYLFSLIGDHLGRKQAFILSITMMVLPTFVVGYIPDYSLWGVYSPISIFCLRLVQSVAVAGESPATACFLYENSDKQNRIFITSWAAFGNQIGAILCILETFFIEGVFTESFVMDWAWRFSFFLEGGIGLFSIYLRKKLEETPMFKKIEDKHRINKHLFFTVWKKKKKSTAIGVGYGIINAATFYMLATYIPNYFNESINLSKIQNGIVSLSILSLSTILLPVFGFFGNKWENNDRWNNKNILILSSVIIIILTIILHLLININNCLILLSITGFLYTFPVTYISALMANLLCSLYKTPIRFTGVSLSFNLADGLWGGFAGSAALLILRYTDNPAGFCWYLIICSMISCACFKIYLKPKTLAEI